MHQLEEAIDENTLLLRQADSEMGDYAFTSDTLRAQLIGHVLERLLDASQEIAIDEAVVEYLEKNLSQTETKEGQHLEIRDDMKKKVELLWGATGGECRTGRMGGEDFGRSYFGNLLSNENSASTART